MGQSSRVTAGPEPEKATRLIDNSGPDTAGRVTLSPPMQLLGVFLL